MSGKTKNTPSEKAGALEKAYRERKIQQGNTNKDIKDIASSNNSLPELPPPPGHVPILSLPAFETLAELTPFDLSSLYYTKKCGIDNVSINLLKNDTTHLVQSH